MWRWTYLGLAILGLVLAGCGGAKQNYKYRIAVIPKGLTHEFWQSIQRGAQRAADDLKAQGIAVEIIWDGPRTESDAQEQISIVNRNVANRVSGLVLAPQHSETMVAPVRTAVEKGIPVVIIDSGLADRDVFIKYVATDNRHGGRLAAERLLKVLRDDGKPAPKLILFRYQTGSESTDQREQGFENYVNEIIAAQQKKGEPTITWLSKDQYAGATTDSALQTAKPLLTNLEAKGIDGIFAPNESSAMGMLKALESLKLNQKVRLVGFDSSPPLLEAIENGNIDGLILQDPYRMGYLGVWTLVQYLEGHNVASDGKIQSTGEYLVTKENLKTQSTEERFAPELQKQRKMDTPSYPKR